MNPFGLLRGEYEKNVDLLCVCLSRREKGGGEKTNLYSKIEITITTTTTKRREKKIV